MVRDCLVGLHVLDPLARLKAGPGNRLLHNGTCADDQLRSPKDWRLVGGSYQEQ